MAIYLDTSAAAKLAASEADSPTMVAWAHDHDGEMVSSDLLRTELLRVVRRGGGNLMGRARDVLDTVTLFNLPASRLEEPPHSDLSRFEASTHSIWQQQSTSVTDLTASSPTTERLANAANLVGITVVAPS